MYLWFKRTGGKKVGWIEKANSRQTESLAVCKACKAIFYYSRLKMRISQGSRFSVECSWFLLHWYSKEETPFPFGLNGEKRYLICCDGKDFAASENGLKSKILIRHPLLRFVSYCPSSAMAASGTMVAVSSQQLILSDRGHEKRWLSQPKSDQHGLNAIQTRSGQLLIHPSGPPRSNLRWQSLRPGCVKIVDVAIENCY